MLPLGAAPPRPSTSAHTVSLTGSQSSPSETTSVNGYLLQMSPSDQMQPDTAKVESAISKVNTCDFMRNYL
jgi:hypothetical protein